MIIAPNPEKDKLGEKINPCKLFMKNQVFNIDITEYLKMPEFFKTEYSAEILTKFYKNVFILIEMKEQIKYLLNAYFGQNIKEAASIKLAIKFYKLTNKYIIFNIFIKNIEEPDLQYKPLFVSCRLTDYNYFKATVLNVYTSSQEIINEKINNNEPYYMSNVYQTYFRFFFNDKNFHASPLYLSMHITDLDVEQYD